MGKIPTWDRGLLQNTVEGEDSRHEALTICLSLAFQVDYLARAKRIEEIPMLTKQYEEEKQISVEFWEQQERERVSCNLLATALCVLLCAVCV